LTRSKLAERLTPLARPLRWLALCIAAVSIASIGWLSYCEYRNSRDVPPPTEAELREHLARATGWILANRASVSTENNAMLWLFIREAGRLRGDVQLSTLASEYQTHYAKGTLSQFFFDPSGSELLASRRIDFPDDWADYQRLFVYGATCNNSVRDDPGVVALLRPSGCDPHLMWLRSPWCRTHQLMGLRFVQKNHCEPDTETTQLIDTVQNSILTELRWDFRVEDAYLQKVLTLLESGRRKDLKPVWIRRILDAQRSDGGWDGVDVVTQLPGNRFLVWRGGRLYPWVSSRPATNLHATAQGLYLLALLLDGTAP
jgi:hypothetical protein